jgi:phosphoglycolate phosphatase-like HAD superfamily hydrolase
MSEQLEGTALKSIIWDLDGTMIDSFGIFTDTLGKVIGSYGKVLRPIDEIRNNFHAPLEESIASAVDGQISSRESQRLLRDFLTLQETHYEIVDHHIFPDALRLARTAAAQDIAQFIVTNREHVGRMKASPRYIVQNSALSPLIKEVVSGDDSVHRKPKPEVIERLLASGDVNPHETIVIGDQYVDAQLAINIGARAILVNRNGEPIPHLDRLDYGWQKSVRLVRSLSDVALTKHAELVFESAA